MTAPDRKTKVQETMSAKYRGMTSTRRMKLAVDASMSGKMSQSEAARLYGVTRSRVNKNVQAERAKLQKLSARSAVAALERFAETSVVPVEAPDPFDVFPLSDGPSVPVQAPVGPVLSVAGEVRRIPPFGEFIRQYFGGLECPDCGRHHEVPAFQDEIADVLTGPEKRVLINVAPYHSKSTLATVQHSVYELCRDPNTRILIVSKSQKLAARFLYQIAKYLTDPTLYPEGSNLVEDWGPFHSGAESWNKEQIYIAGRNSAEKDPSVSALGVGGHIYGIRADTIKFDDIADLENQRNTDRVKEMLTWCTQEAASRVGRSGKLQFIGTRISAGDIYSHLADLPAFKTVRFPCIVDEEAKVTLWPDHFAFENAVMTRDSMTAEQWQLVYQNIDTPGFGASFSPEIIEATYDAERALGSYDSKWALVAGLDPAGAGAQAGFTAFVLLAVDLESGRRVLVDLVNAKQMKAPQLRDQIFDWADRYPLRELRVEANGLQLLDVATPILTDQGWSTMGDLRVGDRIPAVDGSWSPVVDVSSIADRPSFVVSLNDGTSLTADPGHRWFVHPVSHGARRLPGRWVTTQEMVDTWSDFKYWGIRRPEPLEGVEQDLPIDPYVLGVWLGDGDSHTNTITSHESDQPEMRAAIELAGYPTTDRATRHSFGVLGLQAQLKAAGLIKNKHIPDRYLLGSYKQRLALLQGLMDTDGTISGEHGSAVFYNTKPDLIDGVVFLLRSLGYRPSPAKYNHTPGYGTDRRTLPIGTVKFYPSADQAPPFRLSRKADRVLHRRNVRNKWLVVRSVTEGPAIRGRCIRIAHESHQFLAGRELVPTGNSQLVQFNEEIMARMTSRGVRVVPHITTGHNKWDPQFGVESMATMFVNRQISLPTQDVASRNRIRPLVEQLLAFPMGAVTDLVMALWFADLGCREIFRRSSVPMFDTRFQLPGRLAGKRRVVDFATRETRAPVESDMVAGPGRPLFPTDAGDRERRLVNVGGSVFVP